MTPYLGRCTQPPRILPSDRGLAAGSLNLRQSGLGFFFLPDLFPQEECRNSKASRDPFSDRV